MTPANLVDEDMDTSDDDDNGGVTLLCDDIGSKLFIATATTQTAAPKAQSSSLATGGSLTLPLRPLRTPSKGGSSGSGSSSYVQDVLTMAAIPENVDLWRLPSSGHQDPSNKGSTDAPWGHAPDEDPASRVYNKACHLLEEHWRCEPADALPKMFHASTPYSLALLFKLRQLACNEKGDRPRVEKALFEQWQSRVSQQLGIWEPTEAGRMFITTPVPKDFGAAHPLQFCEEFITENAYGVCLEDLSKAQRVLRQQRKQRKGMRRREGLLAAMRNVTPRAGRRRG